jgi:hypothetical protein
MVDPVQSAGVRGDRQGHGRVSKFPLAAVRVMREPHECPVRSARTTDVADALPRTTAASASHLPARRRSAADNPVDVEMVGALEGFDGVEGVWAEVAIQYQWLAAYTAVTKALY